MHLSCAAAGKPRHREALHVIDVCWIAAAIASLSAVRAAVQLMRNRSVTLATFALSKTVPDSWAQVFALAGRPAEVAT